MYLLNGNINNISGIEFLIFARSTKKTIIFTCARIKGFKYEIVSAVKCFYSNQRRNFQHAGQIFMLPLHI